ncbi:MAG: hypothetical protein ACI8SE_001960 [Bacteroidia bacterium]|jgi:hypothetical protein
MRIKQTILFLGIVSLFSACRPLDPNKQIDEGKVEEQEYTSKDLGWTISIPPNWKVTTREQLRM